MSSAPAGPNTSTAPMHCCSQERSVEASSTKRRSWGGAEPCSDDKDTTPSGLLLRIDSSCAYSDACGSVDKSCADFVVFGSLQFQDTLLNSVVGRNSSHVGNISGSKPM